MQFQQDWVMRQIEAIVAFVIFLVTGKINNIEDVKQDVVETSELYNELHKLVIDKKICEAENLLYETEEITTENIFSIAMLFYLDINQLSDEELEKSNFSRSEIISGIQDFCRRYDIQGGFPLMLFDDFEKGCDNLEENRMDILPDLRK